MSDDPKLKLGVRGTVIALREATALAFDTLRVHKLRSFLTLLGVILAVTTLVAVISVLNGLNLYVATKIANLGANAFVVDRVGIATSFVDFMTKLRRPPLRMEDYYALKGHLRYSTEIAAEENTVQNVHYGPKLMEDVTVLGVTPEFGVVRNFDIAAGRFFTDVDETHRTPTCFIGHDVVTNLFPDIDPLGREIRVGAQQCEIIGVAKALGTILGQSQDDFVMLPLSTYLTIFQGPNDSITIFCEAVTTQAMPIAADEVRVLLRARRHVRYQDPDNFGIVMPSSITGIWQSLTANIFGIAVWLTSVFLVVGGIVIMNIMLASVTERTREIGLRKSLGARRRHIVLQFLMESSILAGAGGAAGIIAAEAITLLIRATTPMPMSVPIYAVIIALAVSTAVGLFFGIYPAVRASRLDPIEALRAET
ncbi:MAG TPA: ABC transporter permease [Candidatus Acidoferrales bacterium]|nr:ABC transporter permease [Candidatus Acidoferrales bacterium]